MFILGIMAYYHDSAASNQIYTKVGHGMDTLKTQSKNSTKKDPPSPWEASPLPYLYTAITQNR